MNSNWASSPATYTVREVGSGGSYAGRSSRTRSLNTVIPSRCDAQETHLATDTLDKSGVSALDELVHRVDPTED